MKKISQIPTQIFPIQNNSQIKQQQLIGKGSFGSVWCITQNGKKYAVKKIDKLLVNRQGRQKQLKRQIQTLRLIQNQNVVKFYDFDESDSKFYIIKMQFCEGQNLKKYLLQQQPSNNLLFPNPAYFATKVCLDFIFALCQVRSKMITNRDIKPDNIIVQVSTQGKITTKMIDFGQAKFNIRQAMTMVGTNGYMAPQIYFNRGEYDSQVSDMWSLGITLYQICDGVKTSQKGEKYIGIPFQPIMKLVTSKDFQQYYNQLIFHGVLLNKNKIPGPLRQIIQKCLRPNPKKRLTFMQLLQILQKRFEQFKQILNNLTQLQQYKIKLIQSKTKQQQALYRRKQINGYIKNIQLLSQLLQKIGQKLPDKQIAKLSYVSNLLIQISEQKQKYMNQIADTLNIDDSSVCQQILAKSSIHDLQEKQQKRIPNLKKVLGKLVQQQFKGINNQLKKFIQESFGLQAKEIIIKILKAFDKQHQDNN